MILAGDIGATKTNLAYFDVRGGSLRTVLTRSYPSSRYRSLEAVLADFRREHPGEVGAAAFGIAGPVVAGKSHLTNLRWDVDASMIAASLRLKSVSLLNDLEATAYGTLRLGEEDVRVVQEGTARVHGAVAVIAAGTGLGEGGLFWDGQHYRAIPSEGGHTDFAPRNELEIDLLRFLCERHGHVSYERLVSGPGLAVLYDFFRSKSTEPEPEWLRAQLRGEDQSAVISRAALERRDPTCVDALELFVSLYGAEAGNLALKLLSTGGVYVGGGIAPKILERILHGPFLSSFLGKGRYVDLLRSIPVRVILNDMTALVGAAHAALLIS